LYIHPDECIDCGACEPVCPVEAIFYEDDVPDEGEEYYSYNVELFAELGSPGGAEKHGNTERDHPAIAALPPQNQDVELCGGDSRPAIEPNHFANRPRSSDRPALRATAASSARISTTPSSNRSKAVATSASGRFFGASMPFIMSVSVLPSRRELTWMPAPASSSRSPFDIAQLAALDAP